MEISHAMLYCTKCHLKYKHRSCNISNEAQCCYMSCKLLYIHPTNIIYCNIWTNVGCSSNTHLVSMLMLSWVLAPCNFLSRCQRFGETCCLYLRRWSGKNEKWRAYTGFEEGRLRIIDKSERRNMTGRIRTSWELSSRLQRRGLSREWSKRKFGPFQGRKNLKSRVSFLSQCYSFVVRYVVVQHWQVSPKNIWFVDFWVI
jgi:hypothetical protein